MRPRLSLLFISECTIRSGSGHIMRLLALADFLMENIEVSCTFIAKIESNAIRKQILDRGYFLHDPDFEIIEDWVANHFSRIIFVDFPEGAAINQFLLLLNDFPMVRIIDRPTDQQFKGLLVAPNLFEKDQVWKLEALNTDQCNVLIGPDILPLRAEFRKLSSPARVRTDLKLVGSYFGAVDKENQSEVVLEVAEFFEDSGLNFSLLIGQLNRKFEFDRNIPTNLQVIRDSSEMAEFFLNCDLFIGSFGISAWERCAMGLPTLGTYQTPDQFTDATVMESLGACINLGPAECLTSKSVIKNIIKLMESPSLLSQMSQDSYEIMSRQDLKIQELLNSIVQCSF